jgi:hypothetical protein
VIKIKSGDEQAVSRFKAYRFFYGSLEMWEFLNFWVEEVDW